MVKHGESSKAVSKRDGRSKADSRSKRSSRAKHDHSDDDEEEEVIKISRYTAVDIDEMRPGAVEQLCELLDVRASKVKQWCDRELIRADKTRGALDVKRLISTVDEEDAKKLRRFVKKIADEDAMAKMTGGHIIHPGHHQEYIHHPQDIIHHHHGHSHHVTTYDGRELVYDPHTGERIVANCRACHELGELCAMHYDMFP